MVKRPPHRIEYTPEAVGELKALRAHDRTAVVDQVERKLMHEPTVAARNRKLLRANATAAWELRIGELRVYYDVEDTPERVVIVRSVRVKPRESFLGEEGS